MAGLEDLVESLREQVQALAARVVQLEARTAPFIVFGPAAPAHPAPQFPFPMTFCTGPVAPPAPGTIYAAAPAGMAAVIGPNARGLRREMASAE